MQAHFPLDEMQATGFKGNHAIAWNGTRIELILWRHGMCWPVQLDEDDLERQPDALLADILLDVDKSYAALPVKNAALGSSPA